MKVLVYIFLFYCPASVLFSQEASSLYKLSFRSLASSPLNMADYQGKKIIVAGFSATNPDKDVLFSLNQLYEENKEKLVVIVIPVYDSRSHISTRAIRDNWRSHLSLSYILSDPGSSKKLNEEAVHPLLQWVTSKEYNQHFDQRINGDGQAFVISETGRLFAVLTGKAAMNRQTMARILNMKVSDN